MAPRPHACPPPPVGAGARSPVSPPSSSCFLLTHLARPGRRSRDKAGPPAPCKPRRAPGAGAAAAASMRGARRPAAPPPSCASPALPARPRCRPRGKGRRRGGKGREAAVACRCSAFGSGAERPSEPRGRLLLLLLLLPPPSFPPPPPPPPALGSNRLLPARGRRRCLRGWEGSAVPAGGEVGALGAFGVVLFNYLLKKIYSTPSLCLFIYGRR